MSTAVESRANRPIDANSFADLFPNAVELIEPVWTYSDGTWGEDLRVTFADPALTDNQIYLAKRRMRTTPDGEQREIQAVNAYSQLQNFRTNGTSVTLAQVKLQAQIIQGLIIMAFPDAANDLGITF